MALLATSAAVVAVLPAGTRAATAGSLITPAAARTELAAIWHQREAARSSDDEAALARLDTGAARDRDVGLTRYVRGLHEPSRRVRRPLGPAVVVVPDQTQFPIAFLAFVETTADFGPTSGAQSRIGYETVLLVLLKDSAAAPWQVALETHYAGGLGFTAPPSGEYAPPEPAAGWITPTAALVALANADQYAVVHGRYSPSSPFLPGSWTTGADAALANEGVDGPIDGGSVTNSHSFGVDASQDGVYNFDAIGANLVCGAIRISGIHRPARGGVLLQNAARTNWGGWLAPGLYSLIHTLSLNQVCLQINPTRAGGIRQISGESTFVGYDASGSPAR
jgi:hypothetical protein